MIIRQLLLSLVIYAVILDAAFAQGIELPGSVAAPVGSRPNLPDPEPFDSQQKPQTVRSLGWGQISVDGQVAVLEGAQPVERQLVCEAADGRRWACGLQAAAAWVTYFRTGARCRLSEGKALCMKDGERSDIWLLRNGWAVPVDGESAFDRLAAFKAAYANQLGAFSRKVPEQVVDGAR